MTNPDPAVNHTGVLAPLNVHTPQEPSAVTAGKENHSR